MSVSVLQMVASQIGKAMTPRQRRFSGVFGGSNPQTGGRRGGNSLSSFWPGLSLSVRFAFAAAVVLCNGMAIFGGWVVAQIERGLAHNAATSESVYVQSLFTPVTPQLTAPDRNVAAVADAVTRHLHATPLWSQLSSLAVWLPDGFIIYSTQGGQAGHRYAMPPDVRGAFTGELRASILDRRLHLLYPGHASEGTLRTVYTPLRDSDGASVSAVIEIVSNADALTAELDAIRRRTWIVVGLTTLLMIGILFSIVQNGSQKIEEQRGEIERRLEEEIRLGQMNKALREQLQDANRRGIELGEEQLRRISSDLENGPVQHLALALLRMYELKPASAPDKSGVQHSLADVVDVVEQATAGALREIREISSGLFLPELGRLSAYEAIDRAILAHDHTTGNTVATDLADFPEHLPLPITICMFRVVQEALANAWNHAAGWGLSVSGGREGDYVVITVSDEGAGFIPEEVDPSKLGLRWLRQRVESIGGTFTIRSSPGRGTKVSARFPLLPTPASPEEASPA
jgi:hypothetical protein